jgi:hypothetical protein
MPAAARCTAHAVARQSWRERKAAVRHIVPVASAQSARTHTKPVVSAEAARTSAATLIEATASSVPATRNGGRKKRFHSEDALRALLISLAKPMRAFDRRATLERLCAGLRVWRADEWNDDWRRAAQRPDVMHAVAEGARLAATDFVDGVHIPREAAEQIAALDWPRQRSDFLAFAMPGFCHAAAAVTLALAQAVRPEETWVILVSQLHASVLSLSSATLLDFNAAAMEHVAQIDALTYLTRLIMPNESWAVYPSLELYLEGLRPSIVHTTRLPAWAQPRGCDYRTFQRLRDDGTLDEAFERGARMLVSSVS